MSGEAKPRKKAKALAVPAARREPNKGEVAAIAVAREAWETRPARASFAMRPGAADGVLDIQSPHGDAEGQSMLVAETFGTSSGAFVTSCVSQLADVILRGGQVSVEDLNASLAMVGAIEPQNELEAALAVQMAATHAMSVEMLRRVKAAADPDALRDYGNLATKFSRTFTAQMKALSEWRRGGEQVVRHVHVYEGGQAVVAETVNVGGLGNEKSLVQPYGLGAALPCPDPARDAVPITSDQRQEAMPAARGRSRLRRAKGKP